MIRARKPYAAADDELLATSASHYTIMAKCPCGQARERFARPIQAMLGKGVLSAASRPKRHVSPHKLAIREVYGDKILLDRSVRFEIVHRQGLEFSKGHGAAAQVLLITQRAGGLHELKHHD
jgi:hypothetical protein